MPDGFRKDIAFFIQKNLKKIPKLPLITMNARSTGIYPMAGATGHFEMVNIQEEPYGLQNTNG
jgi:hypothetical protein